MLHRVSSNDGTRNLKGELSMYNNLIETSKVGVTNIVLSKQLWREEYMHIRNAIGHRNTHMSTDKRAIISTFFYKHGLNGVTIVFSDDAYGIYIRITVNLNELIYNDKFYHRPYVYSNITFKEYWDLIDSKLKLLSPKMSIKDFKVTRITLAADFKFNDLLVIPQYLNLAVNSFYYPNRGYVERVRNRDNINADNYVVHYKTSKSEIKILDITLLDDCGDNIPKDGMLRIETVLLNKYVKQFAYENNTSVDISIVQLLQDNGYKAMHNVIDSVYQVGNYYPLNLVIDWINNEGLDKKDTEIITHLLCTKLLGYNIDIVKESLKINASKVRHSLRFLAQNEINPVVLSAESDYIMLYSFNNLLNISERTHSK